MMLSPDYVLKQNLAYLYANDYQYIIKTLIEENRDVLINWTIISKDKEIETQDFIQFYLEEYITGPSVELAMVLDKHEIDIFDEDVMLSILFDLFVDDPEAIADIQEAVNFLTKGDFI